MRAVKPWERRYRCRSCGAEHRPDARRWRCGCGGVLDLTGPAPSFPYDEIVARPAGLWRWEEALPFPPAAPEARLVAMGEGAAPVISAQLGPLTAQVTLEWASPTLSFKDRGAAVLVAKALELGAESLVADSSGNAGTAIAAYAARAGLPCEVFVPERTSPAKLAQIAAHGAILQRVPGDREATAGAAIDRVTASGAFYASHVWNPFFFEGTKTWAFDVWLALGRVPEVVVLPLGNGTLVLGAAAGFTELVEAGVADHRPRIVAVQAAACAPVARAFATGAHTVAPVAPRPTAAEGVAIAAPVRGAQVLEAIRGTDGTVISVDEDEIAAARDSLARQGLYVEPTAAVAAAGGVLAGLRSGADDVVVPLGGAGIKGPAPSLEP